MLTKGQEVINEHTKGSISIRYNGARLEEAGLTREAIAEKLQVYREHFGFIRQHYDTLHGILTRNPTLFARTSDPKTLQSILQKNGINASLTEAGRLAHHDILSIEGVGPGKPGDHSIDDMVKEKQERLLGYREKMLDGRSEPNRGATEHDIKIISKLETFDGVPYEHSISATLEFEKDVVYGAGRDEYSITEEGQEFLKSVQESIHRDLLQAFSGHTDAEIKNGAIDDVLDKLKENVASLLKGSGYVLNLRNLETHTGIDQEKRADIKADMDPAATARMTNLPTQMA